MDVSGELVLTAIGSVGVVGALFHWSIKSIVQDEFTKLSVIYYRADVAEERFQRYDEQYRFIEKSLMEVRAGLRRIEERNYKIDHGGNKRGPPHD